MTLDQTKTCPKESLLDVHKECKHAESLSESFESAGSRSSVVGHWTSLRLLPILIHEAQAPKSHTLAWHGFHSGASAHLSIFVTKQYELAQCQHGKMLTQFPLAYQFPVSSEFVRCKCGPHHLKPLPCNLEHEATA